MSYFSQKLLLSVRSQFLHAKRFRGKINIQRPRQPHYEKARVIAVTTPIFPKVDIKKDCFKKNTHLLENNPYDDIIAKEVLNWLKHSKMVAIYHLNSINQEELFKVKVLLHKQNMHLKSYGKKIIGKAVENTRYEPIHQLFDSNHCIIFSSDEKIAQLLKITKKVSQMILLAGIAQGRLLSRNEFVELAQLPDLQTMRSQLVGVLNMAAGQLVNNLETHQKNFVNILDVYTKDETNNENDTTAESDNTST